MDSNGATPGEDQTTLNNAAAPAGEEVERVKKQKELEERHAKLLEEASNVFKRLDVDRDDVLSIDEFGRELTEMGMLSAGIPKLGDVVQVDGRTGTISDDLRPRSNKVVVIWADTQTESDMICADEVKADSSGDRSPRYWICAQCV